MSFLELLYYMLQFILTMFVLGFAYETLLNEEDDDDDQDGGLMQPCYVTNR